MKCGACGAEMVVRDVAPCLDCGGNASEIDEWRTGEHTYERVGLFDGEAMCDFCVADMPSTHPSFWGFPENLNWDQALAAAGHEYLDSAPPLRRELACARCSNTLRKQEWIRRNAARNGIVVPTSWWPHLGTG